MKKIIVLFVMLTTAFQMQAQTDGISYQAVIIDNNPQEIPGVDIPANNLPNVPLTVRFSILDSGNTIEYQETHETNTDAYGMINLMIGQGSQTGESAGTFTQIYWNNAKYLRVEIDLFDDNGLVEFSFQELTYIPYVKHREIIADGVTNLNSSLNVNNGSPSYLSGDLTVDGVVAFDGELEVGGDTQLYADLTVEGNTIMNGLLNVVGDATFNDSDFQNITVAQNSNLNGQVTINTTLAGGSGSYNAYPLRVEGSPNGIAVRLNAGTPNNSNNFITFFNSAGSAVGRIEGETTSEANSTPEFIYDETILVAEEVLALANIPLAAVPIVTAGTPVAQAGPCTPCITIAAAQAVVATANLIAFNAFALSNLGVTYQSGSADYAEWLERINPNEKITAGDIVGVSNGKVSKYTVKSQQYMVISTKPAILGNMPIKGKEMLYEKVAFMGQVPAKVRGVVFSGDYIIPSGLNDGTGIAVSPNEIKAEQYKEIVGVAWSDVLFDNNGISVINLAIGLNANDVANLSIQHEKKIKALESKYNTLEQRLLALEKGTVYKSDKKVAEVSPVEKETKVEVNQTKYEILSANMPSELSDEIMEDAMLYLENSFKERGVDIAQHSGLIKLFNDESYKAEIIKKAQENYKNSYKNILEAAKKLD